MAENSEVRSIAQLKETLNGVYLVVLIFAVYLHRNQFLIID